MVRRTRGGGRRRPRLLPRKETRQGRPRPQENLSPTIRITLVCRDTTPRRISSLFPGIVQHALPRTGHRRVSRSSTRHIRQGIDVRDVQTKIDRLRRTLRIHPSRVAGVSYRFHQAYDQHIAMHLQDVQSSIVARRRSSFGVATDAQSPHGRPRQGRVVQKGHR